MKHTMKKLLCMTLVIMLLVSAVPMFAAADAVSMPYSLVIDGTTAKTDTYQTTTDSTYISVLGLIHPGYTAYQVVTKEDGVPVSNEANVAAGKTIVFELTTPPAPKYSVVINLVGVGTRTIQVEKNGSITLNENLLSSNGLSLSYNHVIAQWADAATPTVPIANGSSVVITGDKTFNCTQRDAGSGTGTGSGSTGGSGSGSSTGTGTGTTAKFKATFLNANGLECYSEEVVSGGKIGKAASELNALVGTKAGYEHIGWKSSAGKTQTTDEVLRDTITANVTYAPIFKNLTNNTTEVPGSGIISGGSNNTVSNGSGSALHDKVTGLQDVILHVYLNNNFNSEHKHYTITDIAKDGTLSLKGDVKDFLKKYYTAKTSDGIGYDGMYVTDAYFGVKYLSDDKREVIGNDADANGNTTLDKMRSAGVVHLNVMLTNATAKSSSTADSSNYKTGDTIFVPVMAMGLTGTLLAAAYIFGKKRFAR